MTSSVLSREEAIHKYLYLVKYVAGRVYVNLPANIDINDLINDGVFGLMDAIEKYDDTRSVKFETYAITRINGAILDALRSLDWVPRTVRQRARALDHVYERLGNELGRDPTEKELAEEMHCSLPELHRIRQRARGTSIVSLEEPISSSGENEVYIGDTLEDIESDVTGEIERGELHDELVGAVDSLPSQERTVIHRYYFQGETLKQIKALLGISESRVSQIHASAVGRLRKIMRARPA